MKTVKERPILYSGPMIRAILEGRKTQTRRIAKAFNMPEFDATDVHKIGDNSFIGWSGGKHTPDIEFTKSAYTVDQGVNCPYGNVGDRLWARETWAQGQDLLSEYPSWIYRANLSARWHDNGKPGSELDTYGWNWGAVKWKPSIFMPKDACRIKQEVINIDCERLLSISEEDAIAEGVEQWPDGTYKAYGKYPGKYTSARDSYFSLWESINGPESLKQNPFVWVISAKVLEI